MKGIMGAGYFFLIVNHVNHQPPTKKTTDWNGTGEISLAHLQPNLLSFSSAISACEKAGEWQKALLLLESTSSARLSPDVIIYSAPWSEQVSVFVGCLQWSYEPQIYFQNDPGWNYPPPRMPVTTRIIPFLVGNPYKPPFVTVTGRGVDQRSRICFPGIFSCHGIQNQIWGLCLLNFSACSWNKSKIMMWGWVIEQLGRFYNNNRNHQSQFCSVRESSHFRIFQLVGEVRKVWFQ